MLQENKNLKYAIYLRKSTDAEDRQVQSIPDQKKELDQLLKREGLSENNIVEIFEESKSAKKPGREQFNRMLCLIKEAKIDGIVCWKLNRLARNPIDGGEIQWLLQSNIIKSIVTVGREYLPIDNMISIAVELGMANQFILDLSKDVKRGMRGKVDKGWRPMRAPIGYINDKAGIKGEKKIFKDEIRFDIVRRCWELLFTGKYTVPEITEIANKEYGLRDSRGKEINKSTFYKIFKNIFYYGDFIYNGEIYKGKHEPMVTKSEFDYAQEIINGSSHNKRPKTKILPYNGIIVCGECGCHITADEKIKYIKTENKVKNYIYNKCSNNNYKDCSQNPIKYEALSEQIEKYLNEIKITDNFYKFAIKVLNNMNLIEEETRGRALKNLKDNLKFAQNKIDNLISLFISSENKNRELLNEEEYISQKSSYMKEKIEIERQLNDIEENKEGKIRIIEENLDFVAHQIEFFENADYEKKTQILRKMGDKHILKDGVLDISLKEIFLTFSKYQSIYKKNEIELNKFTNLSENKIRNEQNRSFLTTWSG